MYVNALHTTNNKQLWYRGPLNNICISRNHGHQPGINIFNLTLASFSNAKTIELDPMYFILRLVNLLSRRYMTILITSWDIFVIIVWIYVLKVMWTWVGHVNSTDRVFDNVLYGTSFSQTTLFSEHSLTAHRTHDNPRNLVWLQVLTKPAASKASLVGLSMCRSRYSYKPALKSYWPVQPTWAHQPYHVILAMTEAQPWCHSSATSSKCCQQSSIIQHIAQWDNNLPKDHTRYCQLPEKLISKHAH